MSLAIWSRTPRARIAIRVLLRMTATDVCCGPPGPPLR